MDHVRFAENSLRNRFALRRQCTSPRLEKWVMRRGHLLAALALLMSAQLASGAGQVTNVPIAYTDVTQLQSTGPHAFFVMFNVTASGTPPACATENTRFVADLSTPGGQAMAAAILAAQMAGHTVTIMGRGVCDIWPDTESIAYINIF